MAKIMNEAHAEVDDMGKAAKQKKAAEDKKRENEALLPQERDLIGLSLEVKRCCQVIWSLAHKRAGAGRGKGRRVRCSDRSFCQRGSVCVLLT